jgi:hypothetical protein
LAFTVFELVRPPFIQVEGVTVERSVRGVDPSVSYVTNVARNVTATWSVEIVGSDCSGSGVAPYDRGQHAFDWLLFEQYIETDCDLPIGVYPMVTCYEWFFGLRRHCARPVSVVVTDPA